MSNLFDSPEMQKMMAQYGVVHKPGMARELLEEMAPLLAADGIDIDNLGEHVGLDGMNEAFGRAVEQHNLMLSTPVGVHRELSLSALRSYSTLLAAARPDDAQALIDGILPEETPSTPAVSHVLGVALGSLDTWFTDSQLRDGLVRAQVPHLIDRAARAAGTDILALARKGRAFDSQSQLIGRHAGRAVLRGSALAVAGALLALADHEDSSVAAVTTRLLTAKDYQFATSPAHPVARPRSVGSAFGDLDGNANAAADHGAMQGFENWLHEQDEIAAPSVMDELQVFAALIGQARASGIDPHAADTLEDFAELLGEFDSPEMRGQALTTLLDYVLFRGGTAKSRRDASTWVEGYETVDRITLRVLPRSRFEPAAALTELSMTAAQLFEDLQLHDNEPDEPDERILPNLLRVRPVTAVNELLDWLGKRRPATTTGGLRRADIAEVAKMIGISAVGVAKLPPTVPLQRDSEGNFIEDLDTEPTGPQYVQSMWELRELTCWWEALLTAEIITVNTTSVRPGPGAKAWREGPSIKVAEAFVTYLTTQALTFNSRLDADDWLLEIDAEALEQAVAFLMRAIREYSAELSPHLDFDVNRDWMVAQRSRNTLGTLARLGLIDLDSDGDRVTVRPELRRALAGGTFLTLPFLDDQLNG